MVCGLVFDLLLRCWFGFTLLVSFRVACVILRWWCELFDFHSLWFCCKFVLRRGFGFVGFISFCRLVFVVVHLFISF